MLLILTNSFDGTTDLLLSRLSQVPVFRLNTDLMSHYSLSISDDGWRLVDNHGRAVSSTTVSAAYWRKPYNLEIGDSAAVFESAYVRAEMRYALDSIVNDLSANGKFVLVMPYTERRLNKFAQLQLAKQHFRVPPWVFTYRSLTDEHPLRGTRAVCKSMSGKEVSAETVLYTTEVDVTQLDVEYPWFTQTLVSSKADVTVAYVKGRMWALQQKTTRQNNVVDWRISKEFCWSHYVVSARLAETIRLYMEEAQLQFGRLDFVADEEDELWFLEVNPNGQFAWMDMDGKSGLLDAVAQQLIGACKDC